MENNETFKVSNILLLILGLFCAKLWAYLLRDINIPEFFKWLTGIIVILTIIFSINKIYIVINQKKK
ncbi:hypothetical protein ACH36K_14025 [Clostridium sp. MB05]|uniref:hypothetical protein n=1 Tax=Clostridium sp. MB05 TaxID=3376682 RepID=UPI0039825F4C